MPPKKPSSKKPSKRPHPTKPNPPHHQNKDKIKDPIDLTPVPIALQQLLLNTIKSALLPNTSSNTSSSSSYPSQKQEKEKGKGKGEEIDLNLKPHIQTLKSHLYNRDFESAFTDASDELLRAYALRWSAARALGYVGLFRGVARVVLGLDEHGHGVGHGKGDGDGLRVVCIGGGAGAEIVALAAAWRALFYDAGSSSKGVGSGNGIEEGVKDMSISTSQKEDEKEKTEEERRPGLSITAVDIADWSTVVERLDATIRDPDVPALRSCSAPLLPIPVPAPGPELKSSPDTAATAAAEGGGNFTVNFQRSDILTVPDPDFNALFSGTQDKKSPNLVTLMFTLNELFSTSMAKATSFLLRLSDFLRPGTVLLVVDSPGSYSTLKLGGGADGTKKERQYPMKFLLDHTLLSVAEGRWEKVFSQDSRWWRRDPARLSYDVGEGAGLEDMRFQVHVYRRVDS